jgi:hypothetical protein
MAFKASKWVQISRGAMVDNADVMRWFWTNLGLLIGMQNDTFGFICMFEYG